MAWVKPDEHEPVVGEQQEPVAGCGQGFGKQTPCPGENTLGEAQPLAMVTVQKPEDGEQHEPEPGHELGTQAPLSVQVLGEVQLT